MQDIQQQITDCLKETVDKYYKYDEEERIDAVEKLNNVFTNNQEKEEITDKTKRRTNISLSTLNTMNKNDLRNLCTDFGKITGNLKKK